MLRLVGHVFSLQSCNAERLTWQGERLDTLDSSIDKLSARIAARFPPVHYVREPKALTAFPPCRRKRHAPQ